MFIAHAPAGYILGANLARRITRLSLRPRAIVWLCIAGSLLPDVDMLYFYLIDHRQTHHHKYVTHWPIVWASLLVLSVAWNMANRRSKAAFALALMSFCALVHIVMDTVVGDIWWLAPFVDRPIVFFAVPAIFQPWWLNFILHWSFLAELCLLGWAIVLCDRRSRQSKIA